MRLSQLFGRTLRQAPTDADTDAYRLILRAGLARQTASGVFSYLPLGWRVLQKISTILRDEMDNIGGQEVHLPMIVPAGLWNESGRYQTLDQTLWRITDRNQRDFVLAMTHEEVVTDLARREVRSYRQLPYLLYQIQTKVRDEPRPRGGLLRMREFLMKDAYSFHRDTVDLDRFYPTIVEAYERIYHRVGINAIAVQADAGIIGGTGSHEFVLPTEIGEALVVRCPECGYAANQEVAISGGGTDSTVEVEPIPPVELVHTPGAKSIEALKNFFGLSAGSFLKTVVYRADDQLVMAVIRGGTDVNDVKLSVAIGTTDLRLASDDELKAAGIVAGYVSPIGRTDIDVVVDPTVLDGTFIAGANRVDHHYRNVVPGRDFSTAHIADIALVVEGAPCHNCGHALAVHQGIELGHTFKLGVKYSEAMGARYLGEDGSEFPIVMGCYGIGLDRLLAAVVDANHDERGIVWPASVAPYHVHLVGLNLDQIPVVRQAEQIYKDLQARNIEALFDDRLETPGVKFADSELIGLPLRVTVSTRSLKQDSVEVTPRRTRESTMVRLSEAIEYINAHPARVAPSSSWTLKASRQPW